MEDAGARVRIVILDACRDNPFDGRSLGRGASGQLGPRGGLVAYAASAGETTQDNPLEENGLFTKHLLAALQVPGLGVRNLFARVREAVSAESTAVWQKPQTPGLSDELIGEFVFRPAGDPSEDELAESRLAAALGRELSAFHSDGNGWTDLHYAAALNLPGLGAGPAGCWCAGRCQDVCGR